MNRLTAHVALLAGTLTLLACQASPPPDSDSEWAGTVDTLASGRLVVRNPDAPLWRPGEAWELRERFRLGAMEGDGADVFGNIVDVELGPDGALYVLDAQASEVRVFGSDGTHLRTFGRSGRGPGEFNHATGMAFDAHGTLWVMDWGNARYSGFDPNTGALVKDARRLASFAMVPWPGRVDRSNAALDVGLGPDGEPVILGLDSAFAPRDTLPLP
ncbi:MAG TPA: 6-bladed beta-propeller, partial [Vicinamibacterales bacterium]